MNWYSECECNKVMNKSNFIDFIKGSDSDKGEYHD